MKSRILVCILGLSSLLSACKPLPEKYVELTSPAHGTRVYFGDQYLGEVPVQLSQSKLKQMGLVYPYNVHSGKQMWTAWDIDLDTGSAITVQNDPKGKIAGRFRFQANPRSTAYKVLKEGNSEWMVFELGFEAIDGGSERELGQRFTAIPSETEKSSATGGQ